MPKYSFAQSFSLCRLIRDLLKLRSASSRRRDRIDIFLRTKCPTKVADQGRLPSHMILGSREKRKSQALEKVAAWYKIHDTIAFLPLALEMTAFMRSSRRLLAHCGNICLGGSLNDCKGKNNEKKREVSGIGESSPLLLVLLSQEPLHSLFFFFFLVNRPRPEDLSLFVASSWQRVLFPVKNA